MAIISSLQSLIQGIMETITGVLLTIKGAIHWSTRLFVELISFMLDTVHDVIQFILGEYLIVQVVGLMPFQYADKK